MHVFILNDLKILAPCILQVKFVPFLMVSFFHEIPSLKAKFTVIDSLYFLPERQNATLLFAYSSLSGVPKGNCCL